VTPETNIKENNIKIIKDNMKGPSYARNLGVKNSTGEVIIFSDSDENVVFIKEKNFVKKIMEKFNNEDVDYVFADYLPYLSNNLLRNAVNIKDFGSRSDALSHLPEAYSLKVIGNNPFNTFLEYGEDKFLFESVKKKSRKYSTIDMTRIMDSYIDNINSFYKRYRWYGRTIKKYMIKKNDFKPIINMAFGFIFFISFFINLWIIPCIFMAISYFKQRKILLYCIEKKAFLSFLLSPLISIFSYIIIAIFFIQSLFI
jgi:glycosyltransferase involved in cell wall biosynthesis